MHFKNASQGCEEDGHSQGGVSGKYSTFLFCVRVCQVVELVLDKWWRLGRQQPSPMERPVFSALEAQQAFNNANAGDRDVVVTGVIATCDAFREYCDMLAADAALAKKQVLRTVKDAPVALRISVGNGRTKPSSGGHFIAPGGGAFRITLSGTVAVMLLILLPRAVPPTQI